MASDVGMDVEDVQKWWRNVRSQVVHHLGPNSIKPGTAAFKKLPFKCKWLLERLDWIQPYVKHKKADPELDEDDDTQQVDPPFPVLSDGKFLFFLI